MMIRSCLAALLAGLSVVRLLGRDLPSVVVVEHAETTCHPADVPHALLPRSPR